MVQTSTLLPLHHWRTRSILLASLILAQMKGQSNSSTPRSKQAASAWDHCLLCRSNCSSVHSYYSLTSHTRGPRTWLSQPRHLLCYHVRSTHWYLLNREIVSPSWFTRRLAQLLSDLDHPEQPSRAGSGRHAIADPALVPHSANTKRQIAPSSSSTLECPCSRQSRRHLGQNWHPEQSLYRRLAKPLVR